MSSVDFYPIIFYNLGIHLFYNYFPKGDGEDGIRTHERHPQEAPLLDSHSSAINHSATSPRPISDRDLTVSSHV